MFIQFWYFLLDSWVFSNISIQNEKFKGLLKLSISFFEKLFCIIHCLTVGELWNIYLQSWKRYFIISFLRFEPFDFQLNAYSQLRTVKFAKLHSEIRYQLIVFWFLCNLNSNKKEVISLVHIAILNIVLTNIHAVYAPVFYFILICF